MQSSVCCQAGADLFSSVGPILVLHTPCGAVQWIYIVGEEFAGRHVGKIDGTIGVVLKPGTERNGRFSSPRPRYDRFLSICSATQAVP